MTYNPYRLIWPSGRRLSIQVGHKTGMHIEEDLAHWTRLLPILLSWGCTGILLFNPNASL